MSFAAQEQLLLDLLFDAQCRAAFSRDAAGLCAVRGLSADEAADFAVLRPEALAQDARQRAGFILAQYCRSLPLSFALASSLPDGLEHLREGIDAGLIRTPPRERLAHFGRGLRDRLQSAPGFAGAREQALVLGIVEAELGMAWTAQAAVAAPPLAALPADWLQRPLRFADGVSVAILPRPYAELKAALCPVTGAALWRQLQRSPLTAEARQALLAVTDLRLLVARAVVCLPVACEPVVEHVTVELGEGFARLLPHVDGQRSVSSLLTALREAGAEDALVAGVSSGFRQLWQQGMLA